MADIENHGFPFDSSEEVFIATGKYDRGATSEDWAKYVSSMFTDGYIIEPSENLTGFEPFKVTAQAGMTVSISKGTILIKGRMKIFNQPALLTLDQADSQTRIDLICLRSNLNSKERRIYPVVIKGDPSDTPIEPGYIRDDVIYDMIVAKVIVPPSVAKLTQDAIVDTRDDTVYCGQSMTSDARELMPNIVPKGIITMWSGAIDEIPPGWALCDGENGTPDLCDRFITGAGKLCYLICKIAVHEPKGLGTAFLFCISFFLYCLYI